VVANFQLIAWLQSPGLPGYVATRPTFYQLKTTTTPKQNSSIQRRVALRRVRCRACPGMALDDSALLVGSSVSG